MAKSAWRESEKSVAGGQVCRRLLVVRRGNEVRKCDKQLRNTRQPVYLVCRFMVAGQALLTTQRIEREKLRLDWPGDKAEAAWPQSGMGRVGSKRKRLVGRHIPRKIRTCTIIPRVAGG